MCEAVENVIEEISRYLRRAGAEPARLSEHLVGIGDVGELEKKVADHYGARHALCVSSATMGLLVVAQALGLKDSEFITTPLTYGASLSSWLMLGNRPIFSDVDPENLTLDPFGLARAVTSKTRAVLAVDIYGNPSDSIRLREVARELGLHYIGDAAQALGAYRSGQPASRFADATVVSFTVGKTVSAGEGGVIITDDSNLYERLIWVSQHPMRHKRELGIRVFNEFAINARIHPLAAIWANASFDRSLAALEQHRSICHGAIDILRRGGFITRVNTAPGEILPSFFRVVVTPADPFGREEIVGYLSKLGFMVEDASSPSPIYKNQSLVEACVNGYSLPVPCVAAEKAAACVIFRARLPLQDEARKK